MTIKMGEEYMDLINIREYSVVGGCGKVRNPNFFWEDEQPNQTQKQGESIPYVSNLLSGVVLGHGSIPT